jgi:hypothetical protein
MHYSYCFMVRKLGRWLNAEKKTLALPGEAQTVTIRRIDGSTLYSVQDKLFELESPELSLL